MITSLIKVWFYDNELRIICQKLVELVRKCQKVIDIIKNKGGDVIKTSEYDLFINKL